MHLVLQVVTDEALNATVDDAVQTAREQATRKGIVFARRPARGHHVLLGRGRGAGAREGHARPAAATSSAQGWEIREPGEGRFLVQMTDAFVAPDPRARRCRRPSAPWSGASTSWGWRSRSSPTTATTGDQILVQLPGVTDPEQAKRVIKQTAQLTLKLVEDAGRQPRGAARRHAAARCPPNMEVVQGQGETPGQPRLLPGAPRGDHHRPRPEERARGRGREQPARRELLA